MSRNNSVTKRSEFSLPKSYQHECMEVKQAGIANLQAEMINST